MERGVARRSKPNGSTLLMMSGLLAISTPIAVCQAVSNQSSVTPPGVASSPAYEVATVKPVGPNEYGPALRVYIQGAFGIPVNSSGWVIGPSWINSTRYVIRGKPSDSAQKAMQAMAAGERVKQIQLMEQALLADRFKLKAHFEMREMPIYELVIAKDGSKLKENPDSSASQVAVGSSTIRGASVPMHNLIDCLESVPDIGGRVVVDKTGLSGRYDVALKWTPLDATAPPDAEGASLFTAIQDQLGLKLVSTKGPGRVLVIDHIEQPTEN